MAKRLKAALADEQQRFIAGNPSEWDLLPRPEGSFKVGIDGGYVRNWCAKKHNFEVIVGKSTLSFREDDADKAASSKRFCKKQQIEVPQAAPSEEEQLRFYLRSARNREMYEEAIVALRQQSRALETLYQQEMGKVHARTLSPRLRAMGLSGVWFAILDGLTIASGRTRLEVEQALQCIVPQNKLPLVYTFEVHDPAPHRGARRSSTA